MVRPAGFESRQNSAGFRLRLNLRTWAEPFLSFILFYGTPGRIRTCDLQLRRLTSYPLDYGRITRPYVFSNCLTII